MLAKKARRGIWDKQIEFVGAVLHTIAVGSPFGRSVADYGRRRAGALSITTVHARFGKLPSLDLPVGQALRIFIARKTPAASTPLLKRLTVASMSAYSNRVMVTCACRISGRFSAPRWRS